MTTTAGSACIVCGGAVFNELITIPNAPAVCNRLYASEAEATRATQGNIKLVYCDNCGHVFNTDFRPEAVSYNGEYENTLMFSPRYREYADATVARLVERYELHGKRIVEIGCGDGAFLSLLCARGNHGWGYDPASPAAKRATAVGSINIEGREFTPRDARGANMLCCRHVLEHLPRPLALLHALHANLSNGALLFFEVPNALFTLERLSIWDIIHEHVSYFTPTSLHWAFREAGFHVTAAGQAFDDQFLWVEATADEPATPQTLPRRPIDALYRSFRARFNETVAHWRERIDECRLHERRIVVWGGGSKGVMFLNLLGARAGVEIEFVVDINPRKQRYFIPLTGHKILAPEALLQQPPDLVLVMNPEYEAEIRRTMREMGILCDVVSISVRAPQ